LFLVVAAAAFIGYVLLPAYGSPTSRVYASRFGYPSVMRLLDRPIEVEVERVLMRPMVRAIAAEGATVYLNEIPVHSEVPGIVTEILVEPGAQTRRGKTLLRLNPGGHTTRMFELRRQLTQWEFKQAELQWEKGKRNCMSRTSRAKRASKTRR
jgi:hypothetical protein